jgi:hypothetical protein
MIQIPIKKNLLILTIFFVGILFSSCENTNTKNVQASKNTGSTVIAKVEDAAITQFMVERELRFGIDKKVDPNQLLTWKIYEHTLANSLRAKGYDKENAFLDAAKAFRHEALVEEVFQQEVSDKVRVTDEEIKNEIAKRNVKFAFRFFPLQNEKDGFGKRELWLKTSYDSLLKSNYISTNEIAALSQNWQSPLIDAYEIDAELLKELQNLLIGEPSQPINYQGQWVLFEVTDIRRKPIGDWELKEQCESAHKVVWNTKAMLSATNYVDSLMSPLEVRTHRAVFELLSEQLYPVLKEQTPVRSLAFLMKYDAFYQERLQSLTPQKNQILSSWKDGNLSINAFLEDWIPGLYPLRFESKLSFKTALSDAIALLIRDKKLLTLAANKSDIQSDSLLAELRLREDKWLFEQYKNRQLKQILADTLFLIEWYDAEIAKRGLNALPFTTLEEQAKNRLVQRLLAKKLQTEAVKLSHETAITKYPEAWSALTTKIQQQNAKHIDTDFKTAQLFKNYANRPAWPSIDPIWLQLPSQ